MTTRPFVDGYAVTVSDTVDLPRLADAIFMGTAGATGTIRLITEGGHDVTFVGVPVGTVLPVRTRRVYSTTTTASNMVALNYVADYGGDEVSPSASVEPEIVDRAGAYVRDRFGNDILARS